MIMVSASAIVGVASAFYLSVRAATYKIHPNALPADVERLQAQSPQALGPEAAAASIADAADTGAVYHGGPLLANVEVFTLFYGADTRYQSKIKAFYTSITKSPLLDMLSQYSEPGYAIGRGKLVGFHVQTSIVAAPGVNDLIDSLTKLVNDGTIHPNSNTYVAIHLSPSVYLEGACSVYCAFHDVVSINGVAIPFGIIPDQGGFCLGCGPPGNTDAFLAVCDSASHELAEAITDPLVGTGFYDSFGNEVADLCNPTFGYVTGANGGIFLIQGIWSNALNACWLGDGSHPPTATTTTTTKKKTTTKTTTTTYTTTTTTTKKTTTTTSTTTTTKKSTTSKTTTTKKATTKAKPTPTIAHGALLGAPLSTVGNSCSEIGQAVCSENLHESSTVRMLNAKAKQMVCDSASHELAKVNTDPQSSCGCFDSSGNDVGDL
ncbi:UNVERIFIED_CONTAM: hypothetical protein HDU68_003368 [Siphonaria sp. JEL0065]|nr:hypothetical protein HDU68_003368 [Siphonaria sp. JEL0065]